MEKTENSNSQAEESNKKIKRSADKQLTSDDAHDSEEDAEQGQEETWKPADEQTVSQRRKVKVRRNQGAEPTSEPTTTSAAPVANWPKFDFGSLPTPAFPTSAPSAATPEKKPEDKPKEGESPKPSAPQFKFDIPATNFTFQPVSFSPNFSFTPAPPSTGGAPIFGFNIAPPKAAANKDEEDAEGNEIPEGEADSFYNPNAKQEEAKDAEAAIQGSGEEDEIHAFQAKSKLFVLENTQWKERGIGYIRVNVAKDDTFARLIMRTDVSRRVILNFRLWPSILMDKIADKQVRIVGPSADKPKELCSYLIRFGKPELASDFISAVNKHKSTGHSSNSNNNTNTETNKAESEKQPETTAEK